MYTKTLLIAASSLALANNFNYKHFHGLGISSTHNTVNMQITNHIKNYELSQSGDAGQISYTTGFKNYVTYNSSIQGQIEFGYTAYCQNAFKIASVGSLSEDLSINSKGSSYFALSTALGWERGDYTIFAGTEIRSNSWKFNTINNTDQEILGLPRKSNNKIKKSTTTFGLKLGAELILTNTMNARIEYINYLPSNTITSNKSKLDLLSATVNQSSIKLSFLF